MSRELPSNEMSVAEKIQAMESIWNDLIRNSDSIPSPEWHREVLSDREENLSQGTESAIGWEFAKKEIHRIIK